jgi:hypothetical protein
MQMPAAAETQKGDDPSVNFDYENSRSTKRGALSSTALAKQLEL